MFNLLPLAAVVVAILILPGWSFSYDVVPKVVVVLLAAAAALWIQPQRPTLFAWIIYAQIATTILAALFSTHPQLSLLGGTWRCSGVIAEAAVLLLGLAFVAVPRERILRITVIGGLPVALYGILQYFGIDPLIDSKLYHVGEGAFQIVRPPSTLGHADYFATFLLFPIFGGAALALGELSRAWKFTGLAISGVSTLALVLSGTRAALLGLIVGAIFVAIRGRSANWKWFAAAVGLLVIVAAIYVSPAGERLRARVHWSTEDRFGGARPLLWLDSLRMSRQHLLVGFGPETFAREFPRHQSVSLAAAYPDFYHESPHNIFLDALVSKGMLGLIPVIAMAVLGLSLSRGAIGGAFVAMLVSQQFTTFTIATELFFVLTLAMLTAPSGRGSVRIPGRVAAIAFAAFAIYLAVGDALLASALRALNRADFNSAALLQERASKWGATADLNFSRRMLAKSQSLPDPADQLRGFLFAKQAALRAPGTSEDRQNALINLAAFYAVENNAVMVEWCLRDAIEAAPNWFKPHWLLAQVLARGKMQNEAIFEARRAVELDGGKNPEVRQTLNLLMK